MSPPPLQYCLNNIPTTQICFITNFGNGELLGIPLIVTFTTFQSDDCIAYSQLVNIQIY